MDNLATIFISIASYRDPELLPTLRDMLHHAAHPEKLHLAICWQDEEDLTLFEQAGLTPEHCRIVAGREVRRYRYRQACIDIISVHYYASQGACWARSLAETLFAEESYFLQIDSHCRFIPAWDSEMIAMLQQLQNRAPRPLLSGYPPPYQPGEQEEASKKTYVSRLVFSEYNAQGLPMLSSIPFDAEEPVRGSYLAGGFIFTHGSFVKEVANDPQIFFAGEEIAMAVRAFTHGYDIFHPHKPLLWHFYQREEYPKVWGDHDNQAKTQGAIDRAWWERDKLSQRRVRTLLGLEEAPASSLAPWTLGRSRSLREFEYQTGLNLKNSTLLPEVVADIPVAFFATPPADEAEWLRRHFNWYRKTLSFSKAHYCNAAETSKLSLSVYCPQNRLLYQQLLERQQLEKLAATSSGEELSTVVKFKTAAKVTPAVVRLCPWSPLSGWGTVTELAW